MRFSITYFLLTIALFLTELCIALFIHDAFIRPYFGDFLVVILIYCSIKSVLDLPVLKVAIFVLLFSFAIEMLQYCDLIKKLGIEKSTLAKTVFGHSFSWSDILAYICGIVAVVLVEYALMPRQK